MHYVKSPTGTYHFQKGGMRTVCGQLITSEWRDVNAEPTSDLAHTCKRCLSSLKVESDVSHPLDKTQERLERKIRQMKRDSRDTPKIG